MKYNEPTLIEVDAFTVAGLSVRTINKDEFNPETAKLPQLWNTFFSSKIAESIPNRISESPIFGVYSHYASDVTDYYTLTAGVSISSPMKSPELNLVDIQQGHYLVFKDKGVMPQVLIETWKRIWVYFENNSEYTRRYSTDFEVYLSSDEIAIYIGITN
jgi:predicted transcriptional regulator YdeE